ncbi:replication protein A 70 kDa DNA-binding subunit B-like [Asparagus officinalis]|uniref:replication protein A 70 kDa DNA-binding subunit B-like n=1 Tax=Asparagus officinalis TaxID=4686 RepID=UPI00098E0989|nr:replication protein A 70 kDa DNA-binding subunit B-like [Asparagus officinalis]
MHKSQNSIQARYCTFKAKITTILNRLEPWFYACKGCDKKVDKDVSKECLNDKCRRIIDDPVPRYLVKILVENGTDNARVTLFDAAETLIGCKAETFITEKKEKNNQSPYFQKIVLNIGKTFKFLVKLDEKTKDERDEGNIIAQEIQLQSDITIDVDDEDATLELPRKKIKRRM